MPQYEWGALFDRMMRERASEKLRAIHDLINTIQAGTGCSREEAVRAAERKVEALEKKR